jgi:hypothetical protein
MVLAALDRWVAQQHGSVPPAGDTSGQRLPTGRPRQGDPWFGYLVRRLVDSWDLPGGVLRYYAWMLRSDLELARRTITAEWPRVRASLDAGRPVPLGIVTVAGPRPRDLVLNHQVLAYAWEPAPDGGVVLRVYDPNRGPRDDVTIAFATATVPLTGPVFAHTLGLTRPVRGFFVTRYAPAVPPR